MTDEDSGSLLKMIEGHVGRLREQGFDSVQIFCSKYDSKDGTRYWQSGGGCYLSRFGQVSLWIESEKEVERLKRRQEDVEED